MKKVPLTSRSRPRPAPAEAATAVGAADAAPGAPAGAPPAPGASAVAPAAPAGRLSALRRHERVLWLLLAVALAIAAGWPAWTAHRPAALTLPQIDAAIRASIASEPLPSAAAQAHRAVAASVVRVVGILRESAVEHHASAPIGSGRDDDDDASPDGNRSIGTGVVIIDNGTILTNLHVVDGARRIEVTFADGHRSEAVVMALQPEHDLAVLRARSIPDDLQAATMRSTADLAPGDQVIAVGFPFGIGPSTSQGVISGLKRDFRSPEGKRVLSNLIQFDAAANPGNSGGPLVTMDGQVVGIVTAIMNPTDSATFIGIGFAVPIENAANAAGLPPF